VRDWWVQKILKKNERFAEEEDGKKKSMYERILKSKNQK